MKPSDLTFEDRRNAASAQLLSKQRNGSRPGMDHHLYFNAHFIFSWFVFCYSYVAIMFTVCCYLLWFHTCQSNVPILSANIYLFIYLLSRIIESIWAEDPLYCYYDYILFYFGTIFALIVLAGRWMWKKKHLQNHKISLGSDELILIWAVLSSLNECGYYWMSYFHCICFLIQLKSSFVWFKNFGNLSQSCLEWPK